MLLVCAGALAFFVSPWPSVLIIRTVFDHGAARASQALEKHVPGDLIVQEAIRFDPQDSDALLDIYRSKYSSNQAPTIVWVHGGGFVSGRRGDIANYLKILAGRGYNVVNIDYSIAPGAIYPRPVEQVARALRFLNRQARRFNIGGNGFVLAGDSAGAQIAAQTANLITSPAHAEILRIGAPIKPSQLRGALLFCGVYDVAELHTDQSGILGWFLRSVTWAYSGRRNWRDAAGFERMAVARYVTPAFPPSFISAGNADPLLAQSLLMERRLRAQGVAVESLFFPADYAPPLSHEYQFDLDSRAGQLALARTIGWLEGLTK
jgi:acetyl esterase/lipase